MPLAGLQRTDADHMARKLLALLVGDRHDHAIFALFTALRVMNRTLDTHRGNRLRARFRIDGIEAKVMLATRTDIGALQNCRLAVGAYPGRADGALASDAHR
jgi:hypothetical protein